MKKITKLAGVAAIFGAGWVSGMASGCSSAISAAMAGDEIAVEACPGSKTFVTHKWPGRTKEELVRVVAAAEDGAGGLQQTPSHVSDGETSASCSGGSHVVFTLPN